MAKQQRDLTPIYNSAAATYNIDPLLPQAIAQVESGGEADPDNAMSSAGALGRMQVMPDNLKQMNVRDPSDPQQNIMAGTSVLDQALTAANGNVALALRYYQGGTDQSKWGPQNAAYPGKVAAAYQGLVAQRNAAQSGVAALPTAIAAAPAATASAAAPDATDAFLGGATASAGRQAHDDVDTFLAGSTAAPTASAAVPQTAAPTPASPPATPAAPAAAVVEPGTPPASGVAASTAQDWLAPQPNTTYGAILPLAKDNTTGQIRLALPSSLRSLAQGTVDLVDGVNTGTVTPAASNALLAGMTGGMGDGVANALTGSLPRAGSAALRAGSALLPGKSTYADASAAGAVKVANENALAAFGRDPFSPQYLAQQPTGQIPTTPVNPLLTPPTGAIPNKTTSVITIPNRLTGPTEPLPPPPPATDAGTQSIKMPAAPLIPPTSTGAASDYADKVIKAFATPNALVPDKPGIASMGTNLLVPGSKPSAAQALADPGLAALERGVRNADPTAFVDQDQAAVAGRQQKIASIVGTPADIAQAEATRDQATAAARTAAFANTAPVDPTPVVQQIDSILAGPQGQRPGVANPLLAIRDKLVQTDPQTGQTTMQTDPEQLWGVRQYMNDMISPKAAGTPSDGRMAAAQLGQVKDTLDPVIESGAPGFSNFLQQYSDATRPIEAMQYLQGLNLTNTDGSIANGKLDMALKTLTKKQAANGMGPADSVSPDQIVGLQAVQADMQRAANRSNLGAAYGSPTLQNVGINSLLQGVASGKGMAIGSGLGMLGSVHELGEVAGIPGALLGAHIASKTAQANVKASAAVMAQLKNKLSDPELVRNILTSK